MNKIIIFLLSILIIFSCQSKKDEAISIGVILPITGSASVWGQNALNGIELAMTELEKEGININAIIEDSKSATKEAVSALQKLITNNNVQVIIGDIASSSVLAMAPIAEKNNVVLLSPGASNPDITTAGDYIFRNWQSDALEGKIGAEFVANVLGVDNIIILYVNNGYGTGLKEAFKDRFLELNGKVESIESFEQNSKDVRTQLSNIKGGNASYVYMPGYPQEMATVLKQAKELKVNKIFISTQAFDDPFILENAGDAANGTIFSIPTPPDTNKMIVKNFQQEYRKKFNQNAGVCSDTGYDALKIIIDGYKNGARTGTEFKNYLYSVKDFDGASGLTSFDSFGDVTKEFIFKVVKNKKVVYFE